MCKLMIMMLMMTDVRMSFTRDFIIVILNMSSVFLQLTTYRGLVRTV